MSAPVIRVRWRPHGSKGGGQWLMSGPGVPSVSDGSRFVVASIAELIAKQVGARLEVEDDPRDEQLEISAFEGMALAVAGTDGRWAAIADAAIARLAQTGSPFTAYDLTLAGVPEPAHPNHWGPRFSGAARRGLIEAVGYGPSSRPTARHSAARVWRGIPTSRPLIGVAS